MTTQQMQTTARLTREPEHQQLVRTFLAEWGKVKESSVAAARAYKACIDAGINMLPYVNNGSLHEKLLFIASGNLIPISQTEILLLPSYSVKALASLPHEEQRRVISDGIDIIRKDGVEKVPFARLNAGEVRNVINIKGGQGRVLSPAEQALKQKPIQTDRGHTIRVRLSYRDVEMIMAKAAEWNKSIDAIVREALQRNGIITSDIGE
jgi:hypothetical protein